jgi:hypothetical protein
MSTEKEKRLARARQKRYAAAHPDRLRAAKRKYRATRPGDWRKQNMVKKRASTKRWRAANVAHRRKYQRDWQIRNRERTNKAARARYKNDPQHRLAAIVRSRILDALRQARAGKSNRTVKLLGCNISFLIGYLEARFRPGMSWKNYGTAWEIDHRIPCASYDLTDPSHQRSCFHYSNLQPLFCEENRRKSSTPPASHQAELL